MAPALLDDAEDRGEAEAGPFSLLLRRKKRLKNLSLRLGIHPGSRIGDRHHYVPARVDIGGPVGALPVQDDIFDFERELAALRHGVARVHRQVHDHLFHLAGIGLDPSQSRLRKGRQIDILSDKSSEHFFRADDDLVQVDHLGLKDLPPAEGEELMGEGGGALARLLNLFQVAS